MTIAAADLPAEFSDVDPDTLAIWIGVAEQAIDAHEWACAGVDPEKGAVMLTAHFLKSNNLGTDAGVKSYVLTNRSVGGVSVGLEHGAATAGAHGGTAYGRAYDLMALRVGSRRRKHLPPAPR